MLPISIITINFKCLPNKVSAHSVVAKNVLDSVPCLVAIGVPIMPKNFLVKFSGEFVSGLVAIEVPPFC